MNERSMLSVHVERASSGIIGWHVGVIEAIDRRARRAAGSGQRSRRTRLTTSISSSRPGPATRSLLISVA